ncbi:MAG: hypothetical protein JRJ03_11045 [Deltaproteobacteria bacterium]|nr:hypothetical protein [Deltaproteobacteria bacterium]
MTFRSFDRYQDIIPDFPSFVESLHAPLPVHIRVNRLRIETGSLLVMLQDKGIQLKRASPRYEGFYFASGLEFPGKLFEYAMGYFHPQALTSCLAPIILVPGKEALVLDMCAAPGGKTAQMAEIMNNTGLIVANELYSSRHVPLGHTLSRLGVRVIRPRNSPRGWSLTAYWRMCPAQGRGGFAPLIPGAGMS